MKSSSISPFHIGLRMRVTLFACLAAATVAVTAATHLSRAELNAMVDSLHAEASVPEFDVIYARTLQTHRLLHPAGQGLAHSSATPTQQHHSQHAHGHEWSAIPRTETHPITSFADRLAQVGEELSAKHEELKRAAKAVEDDRKGLTCLNGRVRCLHSLTKLAKCAREEFGAITPEVGASCHASSRTTITSCCRHVTCRDGRC